jgi:hypothetical protein
MNSHVNRIGEIYNFIKRTAATPVVLYPGDKWKVGDEINCAHALSRYAEDMQKALAAPPQYGVRKVLADRLIADAENFRQQMLQAHSAMILYLIHDTAIWIKDYKKAFTFNYRSGLKEHAGLAESGCDISVISGALSHCFTTPWGADTLAVNGCFVSPKGSCHRRFFTCLAPARYANAGTRLDLSTTTQVVWRKVQAAMSR